MTQMRTPQQSREQMIFECDIHQSSAVETNPLLTASVTRPWNFRAGKSAMAELWHKNAIVYTVEVDTFADGNGDGWGDFEGLTSKLDYFVGMNVNCIWLQPFYPSPNRDAGYDITDYYSINPKLGSLGEFVKFTHMARERGIRVIGDLVVNHTSIDHPWFRAARSNPKSKYREYYVWSKERPPGADSGMVFPGVEKTTWTYDEAAGEYYFHRFYRHQPELNIQCAAVTREIDLIMSTWLQLGLSGFRVDALPFLLEGWDGKSNREDFAYLIDLRQRLSWERGDAVFMAEANLAPEDTSKYFGEGDRVHVIFNFYANQHLFLALAREQAEPIRDAYSRLPAIPKYCQWANFLRTHDELDLGRLSDSEREEVFAAFAPHPNMRLYNRGIRRRLAPMLNNDRKRLEMAHSLILTLPGIPVLRYGDEIGMGDDLSLPERDSVRTPMQWADAPNGGFSAAPPECLVRPVISEGEFGYQRVNAAAQIRDQESLLNWLERATRMRRRCPEFGHHKFRFLKTTDAAVLAQRSDDGQSSVFAIHNLSKRELSIQLELGSDVKHLWDLFRDEVCEVENSGNFRLQLGPYDYRWYREGQGPESLAWV